MDILSCFATLAAQIPEVHRHRSAHNRETLEFNCRIPELVWD